MYRQFRAHVFNVSESFEAGLWTEVAETTDNGASMRIFTRAASTFPHHIILVAVNFVSGSSFRDFTRLFCRIAATRVFSNGMSQSSQVMRLEIEVRTCTREASTGTYRVENWERVPTHHKIYNTQISSSSSSTTMKFSLAASAVVIGLPLSSSLVPVTTITARKQQQQLAAVAAPYGAASTKEEDLMLTRQVILDYYEKTSSLVESTIADDEDVDTHSFAEALEATVDKGLALEEQEENDDDDDEDDDDDQVTMIALQDSFDKQDKGIFQTTLDKLFGLVQLKRQEAKDQSLLRQEAESKLQDMKEELLDLEDKYELDQNSLLKAQAELKTTKSALDTSETKLERNAQRLAESQAKLEETSNTLTDLRATIQETQEKLDFSTTLLAQSQNEQSSMATTLATVQGTLFDTNTTLTTLQEERRSLRKLANLAWRLSKERMQRTTQTLLQRRNSSDAKKV